MMLLEMLEFRRLMSAVFPSAAEQLLVELINRARANPAAEAALFGIDLNEGLAAGTISAAAKQPLSINPYITDAARDHSQWQIDTDTFSHTGSGGTNPGARMTAAGYVFSGSWTWGENIAWRGSTGSLPSLASSTATLHRNLFVDENVAGRGHRTNMLSTNFREVGAGVVSGPYQQYNAVMATEDFARSGNTLYLTGVAYTDAVTNDDFYTVGEAMAAVTVTATRTSDSAVFSTMTWDSGGYNLALGAGTYTVTAAGGALGESVVTWSNVVIGSQNVKRDFTLEMAVEPEPEPEGPRLSDADFDGDGTSDILFHRTDGSNAVWLMQNGQRKSAAMLPTNADTAWTVGGNGDFNGDGSIDILFHKDDGSNAIWFMDGVTRIGAVFLPTITETGWTMAGAADFDGDFKLDILWRKNSTNENAIWLMDGTTRLGVATLPSTANTNWRMAGATDANSDGSPDILWHNAATGQNAVWLMSNTTRTGVAMLPGTADVTWFMAGAGDYNGDGKLDIRWHHPSGANALWLMNGTAVSATGSLQTTLNVWEMAIG